MAEIDFFLSEFLEILERSAVSGAVPGLPGVSCIQKDKKLMELFVWPFLILLATVYNPFSMRPIIEEDGMGGSLYAFYWLLRRNFCVPICWRVL